MKEGVVSKTMEKDEGAFEVAAVTYLCSVGATCLTIFFVFVFSLVPLL